MVISLPIFVYQVGVVKNKWRSHKPRQCWNGTRSKIIIEDKFEKALDGIEEYSHIVVVFWMDQVTEEQRMMSKIKNPYGLKEVNEKGVLATRLPFRPNPIGVSIVKLVERKGRMLIVENLDALNNTPIIDIKPYTGHPRDLVLDYKIPQWEKKVLQEHH